MTTFRSLLSLSVAVVVLTLQSGCSVFMAAKQPPKKDLAVLEVGTHRARLIAEFGAPVHTETKDGNKVDVFKFVQGYSTGAKTGRAVFHGAADVFTLGLWEVVGTPTEAAFDGQDMAVQVSYDAQDQVAESVVLKHK
jgi:hypothetical protein